MITFSIIKYLKIFGIYLACGMLISALFMLCTGSGISGLLEWGDLEYGFLFYELFDRLTERSLDFTIYVGVGVRLFSTAIFAGIGMKRFKIGLVSEIILSVLNIGVHIWILITTFR